ncbi:MAG: hypothetical protein K0S09_2003 [Sphingobacteriaceae bacterium]|jgi:hypothetical protein|nr:hypothetical protein [Sphingobacteriaceae bacterium]
MKTNLIYTFALAGALFTACNSSKNENESALPLSQEATDSIAATPLLVKTADIKFKVKDAAKCGQEISALAEGMHGMVTHHQLASTVHDSNSLPISEDSVLLVTSYSTQADITVKVPSEHMETFMNKVADMAVLVENRNMDIEDKSLDYLSNILKAENRDDVITQQEKPGTLKAKEAEQLLSIKDDKVDRTISNYRTKSDVEYSTVSLSFYQNNFISKEKVANPDLTVYRVPFTTNLKNGLESGWHAFEALLIAIAHLWAFILLAIMLWIGWKTYKAKQIAFVSKPQV